MRVLTGRPLRLTHAFLDEEDPVTGIASVSVTLTGLDGTEVTASASLNADSWEVTFPAQPLGEYRVTWAADNGWTDTTTVEVVGSVLFTIPAARNSDDYLRSAEDFPAGEMVEYREVVEREFQRITGRSFTTRVRTLIFKGDGTGEYYALTPDAQAIESVTVDGVAQTGWEVSRLGRLAAPNLIPEGAEVVARVRYGFATPPPDVARAGMVRLRHLLAAESSAIPDRATTWQPEEGGTFRLATPGMGNSYTGIPEVDATLKDYRLDVVLAVAAVE